MEKRYFVPWKFPIPSGLWHTRICTLLTLIIVAHPNPNRNTPKHTSSFFPGMKAHSGPASAPTRGLRLALFAGLLLYLAHPPVACWPLAWVALVPLMLSVTRATRLRQAIWRGYLFGWIFLAPVWYWVGITISTWARSPIGWIALIGLTAILAWFYGFWGGAAWWLTRRTTGGTRILAFAAAWAVMEWARTVGSLTMPWAQVAYSQVGFLPVIQFADIAGAYGVSFLVVLMNGALVHAWTQRGQPDCWRYALATGALTLMLTGYGVFRLRAPEPGRPLRVAAMQGNYQMFGPPQSEEAQIATLRDLTHNVLAREPLPSLYVWSESAAPGDALHGGQTLSFLTYLAREANAPILIGSRVDDITRQEHTESNASLLITPYGKPQRYNKRQLVAFGEFIPYRDLFPGFVSQAFDFFPDDVTPGVGPVVLRFQTPQAGQVAVGPIICYEIMYPDCVRDMAKAGANLLAEQSNDGWFLSKAAMAQHLAAVTFRAIENRRQIVRASSTGVTCLVDSRGRIVQRAPLDVPTYLVGMTKLNDDRTLYTRFGDWFVAACGLFLAGLIMRAGFARRHPVSDLPMPEPSGGDPGNGLIDLLKTDEVGKTMEKEA